MAFSNTLLSLTKISSSSLTLVFPNLSMMTRVATPPRFRTFCSYHPKEYGKRKYYNELDGSHNGNYEQPTPKRVKNDGNYEQTPKEDCLSDLVEKEGEEYLRKLRKCSSETEFHSTHELAKSGAMLSGHAQEIKKLGLRLLSVSIDRIKSNP